MYFTISLDNAREPMSLCMYFITQTNYGERELLVLL